MTCSWHRVLIQNKMESTFSCLLKQVSPRLLLQSPVSSYLLFQVLETACRWREMPAASVSHWKACDEVIWHATLGRLCPVGDWGASSHYRGHLVWQGLRAGVKGTEKAGWGQADKQLWMEEQSFQVQNEQPWHVELEALSGWREVEQREEKRQKALHSLLKMSHLWATLV